MSMPIQSRGQAPVVPDLPAGGGTGPGGGGTGPGSGGTGTGGGPPRLTYNVTINQVPDFHGSEPGALLTVVATADKLIEIGDTDTPFYFKPRLTVDGKPPADATLNPDGSTTFHCRVYRSGSLEVKAIADSLGDPSSNPPQATPPTPKTATVNVKVTLDSPKPRLSVSQPVASQPVDLLETGADVGVVAAMSDPGLYGGHTVIATPDHGIPTSLQPHGAPGTYSGTVHFDPMPLGQRTLTVTASCTDYPAAVDTVTQVVVGRDVTPPKVTVTSPQDPGGPVAATPVTGSGYTVPVTGTTTDPQSGTGLQSGAAGLATVSVALSPTGPPSPIARPLTPGDWTLWTVDALQVPTLGPYQLYVWATDNAGNTTATPFHWSFEAVSSWVPATLDDRLSELEYLRGLLEFASGTVISIPPSQPPAPSAGQVTPQVPVPPPGQPAPGPGLPPGPGGPTGGPGFPPGPGGPGQVPIGAPVTPQQLATVLAQRVDAISQPATPAATAAQVTINELRVPVEILRTELNGRGVTASTAGQTAYLTAAYQALLAGIGTSYTELREARGAQPADRAALAARIGISLYNLTGSSGTARNDQLDALLLDGATLTEQALQNLFGLLATTPFDPANPPTQAVPQVLGWQQEAQRNQWQSQDAEPPAPLAYTSIVDPDVITAADVLAGSPQADQVIQLLKARADQLSGQATMLAAARSAASTAPDGGLSALLAAGLPAGVDIGALHADDVKGVDISAQLAAAGLDRTGFSYLVNMLTLATAAGPLVTDTEWSDAVDVLVGSFRRRQYPMWTGADPSAGVSPESGIVLSPDTFVLTDALAPAGPLRIDPAARRDWQATLRTRTMQRHAMQDAATQAVAAAEVAALPVLRDALLADLAGAGTPPADPTALGETISQYYQTDVLVAGGLTTTRLDQAITSMQTLLLLVRSGENTNAQATGTTQAALFQSLRLSATADAFDAAWSWIGTYGGWKSATSSFLFPEASLDPGLLAGVAASAGLSVTQDFIDLSAALGAGPGLATGPLVQAYLTGDKSTGGSGQGVQTRLTAAGVANFSYPTTRSTSEQKTLSDNSTSVEGTDPNLALEVFWATPMLIAQRLHADGAYQAALDWLWHVFPYTELKPVSMYDKVNNELEIDAAKPDLTFNLALQDWATFGPYAVINTPGRPRPYPHLRATLLAIISCLLDYADSEFGAGTDEAVAHADNLYHTAQQLLAHQRLTPVQPSDPGDAPLPIPQLEVFSNRAATQISKIRRDYDIAGLPRIRIPAGADPIPEPTPYHFKVLLTRAQQLAQQATSMEGEYLAALEKHDAKQLQLSDAQHAANVANAQVDLQAAQVKVAADGVAAAQAQLAKANAAVSTLSSAIAGPPNQYEQTLLDNYGELEGFQDVAVAADTMIAIAQAAARSPEDFGISEGIQTAGYVVKAGAEIGVNEIQRQIAGNQLKASIENRQQQWRIQLASAQQDVQVATAQVTTATDQVSAAQLQKQIASLQADQAAATLTLLHNQLTSPAMYKWLSDTLGGVYRYFLQLATATARLAQAQLAFERAEPQQSFIATAYWQPPSPPTGVSTVGLTGAERLTEDLSKLDQYAFSTDTRRLNITQTFSLAALAPVEFLNFRATGQLSVATPTALFDQDFPGHYQRLIRQARLSIVALVPPNRGIRATLLSNGMSRVTVQRNGMFSEVLLRRDPSVVALTSPIEANGVFTTDLQPDMLLPFEGSGVDTTWEVLLPKAANPFDFRSISDVLLTIDYTALYDVNYQSQVVRQLNANRGRSSDRVFSLVNDFPDQWYALNNPDPSQPGRSVTLALRAVDFPPDVSELAVFELAVQLSGSGPVAGVPVTLTGLGQTPPAQVTDATGTASTRRGAGWNAFIGRNPAGDWQLSLDASADPLFASGGLDDVLFVIGWTGTAPVWPS
ncbi:MAG: hypothetical protein J2P15_08105 [Micromonosporaceae bacterium]|nr:hypothetical protein [Micromonosporaceae bacterium]